MIFFHFSSFPLRLIPIVKKYLNVLQPLQKERARSIETLGGHGGNPKIEGLTKIGKNDDQFLKFQKYTAWK